MGVARRSDSNQPHWFEFARDNRPTVTCAVWGALAVLKLLRAAQIFAMSRAGPTPPDIVSGRIAAATLAWSEFPVSEIIGRLLLSQCALIEETEHVSCQKEKSFSVNMLALTLLFHSSDVVGHLTYLRYPLRLDSPAPFAATKTSRRSRDLDSGEQHWFWRAVDQNGLVLDVVIKRRRAWRAAQRRKTESQRTSRPLWAAGCADCRY